MEIDFQVQASENQIVNIDANPKELGAYVQSVAKNLWGSPKFSDLKIIVDGVTYYGHKALLSAVSPLLSSQIQQCKDNTLRAEIDRKDVERYLMMLQYIYKGSIDAITFDQVSPLLSIAHAYGIKPLKEHCGEILANNVNADNAFQFLQVASSFGGVESLQTACAHFISKNFLELLHDKSQAIFKLDPFTFKKMIESEDLRIKTERDVFEAVLKYVAQFSGSKKEEVLSQLLPAVRWNHLPMKYLVEVVENLPTLKENPLLKNLLHQTYKYKVLPSLKPAYETKRRRAMQSIYEFHQSKHGPNIKFSDEGRTAINTVGTYDVVHSAEFYDEGIHVFRVKVVNSSYVGIGIVDEAMTTYNQEFHNKPGCYVYYMSGPGYSNGSGDGNIEGFQSGDVITVILNMDEKAFQLKKKGRVIKKMTGLKGRKALGCLLSNQGKVSLMSEGEDDESWES